MATRPADVYTFGGFRLEVAERRLVCDGQPLPLVPKAFDVLVLLVERAGRLVPRETLIAEVWRDTFVEEGNLNYTVSLLRKALGDSPDSPRFIETVPKQGYRFMAPVEASSMDGSMRRRRPSWTLLAGAAALVMAAAVLAWLWTSNARVAWAHGTAVPEIEQLVEQQEFDRAFRLMREVTAIVPRDRRLEHLESRLSRTVAIDSDPPGAEVHVRGYQSTADWLSVGRTPIEKAMIPAGFVRFRLQKAGFQRLEAAFTTGPVRFAFTLTGTDRTPDGMVLIPGSEVTWEGRTVRLEDYWIDRYEVTNGAYAAFVRAGGYARPEFWKHPFLTSGQRLSFDEAMASFTDATRMPGPSTWVAGTYAAGQEQHPVSGVSWYEAAAYAEFAGKSLPTLFHWRRASGIGPNFSEQIALRSNFGQAPVAVGAHDALSTFGTHDMAGNVREWTLTGPDQERRYLMGGAFSDPLYVFLTHPDGTTVFDRSPKNGFRCVTVARPPDESLQIVPFRQRDYSAAKPIDDVRFETIRQLFSYDALPLNARVESVDSTSPWWTDETVSFDAAYDGERMQAHLLLPKQGNPPYHVVLYYPGDAAFSAPWDHPATTAHVEFLLRRGRAVLYPLFKGMHDRKATPLGRIGRLGYRDRVVHWQKDLARSIDYASTRTDLDATRLAFFGFSRGGMLGPLFTALNPRLRAAVLLSGGFDSATRPDEIDIVNFAPRARVPTLMIYGRYDPVRPLATNGQPLFDLLGAPPGDKRLAITDAGHIPPFSFVVPEVQSWLDRYLGPVRSPGGSVRRDRTQRPAPGPGSHEQRQAW